MHGEWPLPGSVIEAGNGMIFILEGCMLISAALYFASQVRLVARSAYDVKSTRLQIAARVYARTKASWAATIIFFGLFLRTGDVWWVRHLQNHGGDPGWFGPLAQPIIIASSVPIIWGAICWMRAVLPLRFSPWAWVAVTAAAILFGVWMAV